MSFSYHESSTVMPRTIDGAGFGKVAIITGCASGIGLATTQLFLSHQYQVMGIDINDIEYAKIDDRDQERFHFHKADLLKDGECEEIVRICVAEFGGRIDVLANVAGIMDSFAAADVLTDKEWDRVIGVNLTAPTRLMRAVLPFMKEKKSGSIINVSSKAGVSGAAAGVAYTASKHGLLGVTKNTAWRFHKEGIRCNAVLPGAIDTNFAANANQENWDMETLSIQMPVHTLKVPPGAKPTIIPMEVANTILFLASDQARAINGVSLPVDEAWSVI